MHHLLSNYLLIMKMPKRANTLMPSIADIDNIRLAYLKARRGKSMSQQAIKFQSRLDCALLSIREQLLSDTYTFGPYNYFKVFEPKERIISAAPFEQKVVHHAIINVCHPLFERCQIYHNYACRIGKGVKRAINQVRDDTRNSYYFLKLDFRKYFDSIDHNILMDMLRRLFKEDSLLGLFQRLLDSYQVSPGKGLPIGNLTSQYFANHYLCRFDHFIIEQLSPYRYYRYMDDTLYIDQDRQRLKEMYHTISTYAHDCLQLTLKPPIICKVATGIPFLGFKIYEDRIDLLSKSKLRYRHKYLLYDKLWKENTLSEKEYQQRISSLTAFVRQADSKKFLDKWIQFIES